MRFPVAAFALLLALSAHGQPVFDTERYLSTALYDQELERFQAQLDFLGTTNYNSNIVRRVEFRIGSEDANISLNEYRLRLSAANPRERSANKKYHAEQQKALQSELTVSLNTALKNRYAILIELIFNRQQQLLFQQKLEQLGDQVGQLTAYANSGDADFEDLVRLQEEQTNCMLKLDQINTNLLFLAYNIQLDYPEFTIESQISDNLIPIENIRLRIGSVVDTTDESPEMRKALAELALDQQMLEVNKAESQGTIGYIQSNFDTERGDEIEDHIGFQVGVRLPIFNPDKADINRQKTKLVEQEAELRTVAQEINMEKELNQLELERLFIRYDLINDRLNELNLLSSNVQIMSDWSARIRIMRNAHNLNVEKQELETDIRFGYLSYLAIRGALVRPPLVNHFSPGLAPIE